MKRFLTDKRRYRIPSPQQLELLSTLLECADDGTHGYTVMQQTDLSPATLYGLLKRLFEDGYLSKDTQTVGGRRRVCYRLTHAGRHYAERALLEDEYERGAALHLETL